ncbi:MAG TPA: cytochrome c biogenesis protein CcsA [Chthoniobacterales bacterium]
MKKWLPYILVLFGIALIAGSLRSPKSADGFDRDGFGRLPVLVGGRIKPMDTLARTSLMSISGKQALRADGRKIPAINWLIDVLMRPERADEQAIFPLSNPEVRDLLGWREDKTKAFSFNDLAPFLSKIEEQAGTANEVEAGARSVFQKELLKLRERLLLYIRLKNSIQMQDSPDFARELTEYRAVAGPGMTAIEKEKNGEALSDSERIAFAKLLEFAQRHQRLAQAAYVYAIPRNAADTTGHDWQHIGQALAAVVRGGPLDPAVDCYAEMISAYRANDPARFNTSLHEYQKYLQQDFAGSARKIGFESFFNQFQPFYQAMVLYVLIFVLAWISWLVWPDVFGRAAFWLLILALGIHTFGLVARMYLQGRPPVTNLYSSAIFVGWGSAVLCVILERINRNGIGSVVAAAMGFVTLLIAHHLSVDGDTMEMLRAVLDTNIWLATHVVVVTLGYSATFLAGFLAIVFILRGVFTRSLAKQTAKSISSMVYGIVCFATLFSFTGTILGGIWADQSWGRFWGWDPKENGALLIVIWNAIILHARWGGMIRERGLMALAVGGNIITSFSWFGVNMLGVGLHSYGFMDRSFPWLLAFDISQVVLIGLALLPVDKWRSFSGSTKSAAESHTSVSSPEQQLVR